MQPLKLTGKTDLAKKTVSADSGDLMETVVNLWPFIWPSDRPELKLRVLWATMFLFAAKGVLILVPYFYKWATDALVGGQCRCFLVAIGAGRSHHAGRGSQCSADYPGRI